MLHIYTKNHLSKKDIKQIEEIKENKFLSSLLNEIENCYLDSPRDLCFIAKITIRDYFKLLEKNKTFIIKNNAMCGLVDSYNGGGSVLEIELLKDIKINTNDIDIKIEGLDNYTVDQIYGLTGDCFRYCVEVE